jgi:hypothetical protein
MFLLPHAVNPLEVHLPPSSDQASDGSIRYRNVDTTRTSDAVPRSTGDPRPASADDSAASSEIAPRLGKPDASTLRAGTAETPKNARVGHVIDQSAPERGTAPLTTPTRGQDLRPALHMVRNAG